MTLHDGARKKISHEARLRPPVYFSLRRLSSHFPSRRFSPAPPFASPFLCPFDWRSGRAHRLRPGGKLVLRPGRVPLGLTVFPVSEPGVHAHGRGPVYAAQALTGAESRERRGIYVWDAFTNRRRGTVTCAAQWTIRRVHTRSCVLLATARGPSVDRRRCAFR